MYIVNSVTGTTITQYYGEFISPQVVIQQVLMQTKSLSIGHLLKTLIDLTLSGVTAFPSKIDKEIILANLTKLATSGDFQKLKLLQLGEFVLYPKILETPEFMLKEAAVKALKIILSKLPTTISHADFREVDSPPEILTMISSVLPPYIQMTTLL